MRNIETIVLIIALVLAIVITCLLAYAIYILHESIVTIQEIEQILKTKYLTLFQNLYL